MLEHWGSRRSLGVAAIAICLILAACNTPPSGLDGPSAAELPGAGLVGLDDAQSDVVEASVKKMLPSDAANLQFVGVTARRFDDSDGLHVCGYVSGKGLDGQLRFYIELSEDGNKPKARRGQVGTDEATLAKVRFVCRRHEAGA